MNLQPLILGAEIFQTRQQGFDPLSLKGSYAGAMGYGQFMPSSFLNYAVDFDGDGVTDIWNNPVDAIGSVANYFREHGWRKDEIVVTAATVEGEVPGQWFVKGRKNLKPAHTVAEFAGAGVIASQPVDPEAMVSAMEFELKDGYEYWLGFHNFYVITRYNRSPLYAMAVHELSEAILAGFEP